MFLNIWLKYLNPIIIHNAASSAQIKVIQQYEASKLQKDIAHDLGISTGSVSTILKILKASKDNQKNRPNNSWKIN